MVSLLSFRAAADCFFRDPQVLSRGTKKEAIIQRDGTAATDLRAPRTVPQKCRCGRGGGGRGGPGRAGPSGAAPTPPRLRGRHQPRLCTSRPTSAPAAAAAGRAPAPPVPRERPRGGPGRAALLRRAVLALPVRGPRGSGRGGLGLGVRSRAWGSCPALAAPVLAFRGAMRGRTGKVLRIICSQNIWFVTAQLPD